MLCIRPRIFSLNLTIDTRPSRVNLDRKAMKCAILVVGFAAVGVVVRTSAMPTAKTRLRDGGIVAGNEVEPRFGVDDDVALIGRLRGGDVARRPIGRQRQLRLSSTKVDQSSEPRTDEVWFYWDVQRTQRRLDVHVLSSLCGLVN